MPARNYLINELISPSPKVSAAAVELGLSRKMKNFTMPTISDRYPPIQGDDSRIIAAINGHQGPKMSIGSLQRGNRKPP